MGAAGFEFSFNVSYTVIIHIISIIDIPFENDFFSAGKMLIPKWLRNI